MSLREDNEDNTAVWLNDQPAGALYQRPYMISFEDEDEPMVSSYLGLLVSLVVLVVLVDGLGSFDSSLADDLLPPDHPPALRAPGGHREAQELHHHHRREEGPHQLSSNLGYA